MINYQPTNLKFLLLATFMISYQSFNLQNSLSNLQNQIPSFNNPQSIGTQVGNPNSIFDSGIYCIQNVKSSKNIGVVGNGTKVLQNGNECSENYKFRILKICQTDYYRIESLTGRGAMTVTYVNNNKQPVVLSPYNSLSFQHWTLSYKNNQDKQNKEIQFINVGTGHTLDIWLANMNNLAEVIGWVNNHGGPNERWRITLADISPYKNTSCKYSGYHSVGHVVRNQTEFIKGALYCMKAVHSNKTVGYANEGNNQVYQYGYDCDPEYLYRVSKINNSGEFRIINHATNKDLTEQILPSAVHPIKLHHWDNLNTQKWKFIDFSEGEFQFYNSKTKFFGDIEYGSASDNRRLIAYYKNHKGKNQRFTFTLVKFHFKNKPKYPVKIIKPDVPCDKP